MKSSLAGLRRYLYEYQFYLEVGRIRRATGNPVPVSAARALRAKVDDRLRASGHSMDEKGLAPSAVQAAFHEALSGVPGYDGVYADPAARGTKNPGMVRATRGFYPLAGLPMGSQDAKPGPAGPVLPVSPYDPRWATRSTVKSAGGSLRYITDHDVELRADKGAAGLSDPDGELALYSMEEGRLRQAGPAYSRDDHSGMTELMGYMGRDEYRRVRDWVLDQDPREYMSAAGLARSKAILEELRSQGVEYSVVRGRGRGQLSAHVEGTKISVRLADTRTNERYVGRVYDDGISMYFSTNHRTGNRYDIYEPGAEEAAMLVRIAQGLPVRRTDGKGFVGVGSVPGDAYFGESDSKRTSRFVFGDYVKDGKPQLQSGGAVSQVFVHRRSDRSEESTWFGDAEEGAQFLRLAVDTARLNLANDLEVDRLIAALAEHREQATAGEWSPEFSGDEGIAAIQRSYWDVLRGARTSLLRPGVSPEDYHEAVSAMAGLDASGDERARIEDMLGGRFAFTGTPEERVRAHADSVPDAIVGTYEPREVVQPDGSSKTQTFDPAAVARHMSSPFGSWRNGADLIAALRATGVSPEDARALQGEGAGVRRTRDALVVFDEASAVRMEDLPEGGFLREMAEVAGDALTRNGVQVTGVRVDGNGILDWSGIRRDRQGRQLVGTYKAPERLHGQIGQLFEPREHGEVVTGFAGGDNYLFAPGYEARILPQKAGEALSVEERTRLRGYRQVMADQIRYRLAGDSLTKRTEAGGPTVLNGVYRRLYDERHPVDYLERAEERGLGRGWAQAVLETEARRVRYPDKMADTFYESWAAEHGAGRADAENDSFDSPLALAGGRNMAVMDERGDGFFDPDLTNAAHPGVTRFLVESARVDADGRILRGEAGDRAPAMKHPDMRFAQFDPYDRRQMTGMNLLHASGVTEPARTALMTFGGWGLDDGVVVSSEFAARNRIMGRDGELRDLVVGDKISDLHGNKGVISLVVDRTGDYEKALDARDQSMMYAASVFRQNLELDVVMSPFSAVGRFNGGTARELMESPGDMTLPFKGMQPALSGQMRFIVTHKDVRAGTVVYDEDEIARGRGRKASAQLAWALDSQGASEVLREFYGPNGSAAANLREILVAVGLEMGPDGTLSEGVASEQSDRRLFAMPALRTDDRGRLQRAEMRTAFATAISSRGGDMEMPFPLRFPSPGAEIPGRQIPATGNGTWRMPVLSSHLRTGGVLEDGAGTAHEYTTQYLKAFEAACDYRYSRDRLDGLHGGVPSGGEAALRQRMEADVRQAQAAFDTVSQGLIERKLTGRGNIFKEGIMSSRLADSATAVWSADPRLDLDQIGMGPEMAASLGVGKDDYVLVWRDPVLRDAGVRYLRVAVDPRLTGVAINPVMDKGFDGDFDGDSVAVVKLHSERAKAEAMAKLSVEANLLDMGAVEQVRMGQGRAEEIRPLMMQDSLDVRVTQSVAPRFVERFGSLTMRANEVQSDFEDGAITASGRLELNRGLLGELSAYYREAMEGQYGDAALSFADPASHLQSVREACLDTGAKGSEAKLAAYGKHLGVLRDGRDAGRTLHTREEDQGVMVATAVKSAVGIAGAFSQRGVKALRDSAQKSVLELTYPVTQSLLQSKHDPHEAMRKYTLLLSSARELWRGRLMEAGVDADGARAWSASCDKDGAPIQATPEQWREQFLEIYRSSDGLNIPSVDPEHVDTVAAALTGPDGRMRDIEEVGRGADRIDGLASSSTMDRLAYGGTFADLCAASRAGENVFGGTQSAHFAPFVIRDNLRELDQYERRIERAADDTRAVPGPELVPFGNRDVLAASTGRARERGASKRSGLAVAVVAPRYQPPIPEPETGLESDGFEYGF